MSEGFHYVVDGLGCEFASFGLWEVGAGIWVVEVLV